MEDILKKSREIAKMLGATIHKDTSLDFEDPRFKDLSGMTILQKTNKFLTDGDVQMKILEHIEDLDFICIIAGKECNIESNEGQYDETAWWEKTPAVNIVSSAETKKEAIFEAVYQFSLMFNKQSNDKGTERS